MDRTPILQASSVGKCFGKKRVLTSVDLSIFPGECVVLIGANGAGKTTLLEIFQGLLTPDEGTVLLFGRSLFDHRHELLRKVGVVLQETSLYKRFTVNETLSLFASFYGIKRGSWDDILVLLGLEHKRHAYLKNLSGGEKQKVYLATALIHQPKLLFLDEPSTGLDPTSRAQIWQVIQKLQKNGCAVLLTTHYMEEAEALADRLAILHQGKMLAQGAKHVLTAKFAGHTSIALSFALSSEDDQKNNRDLRTKMIAALEEHPQVHRVSKESSSRLTILWRKGTEDFHEVLEFLSQFNEKPVE
ncbi:MAG: ABC transporter ATP-binding protein, partial [Proteobacteria bacterium]|nr:ABC transporter ATP-binding protein [Pseudomonadota bacterium]